MQEKTRIKIHKLLIWLWVKYTHGRTGGHEFITLKHHNVESIFAVSTGIDDESVIICCDSA